MYRLLLPLIFFISLSCFADDSTIRHLTDVNAEWKNHPDGLMLAASADVSNNKTFDDWIATHLMLVEQTLRQRPVENLTAEQKQNRLKLLDELNGYWHSRAFPRNDYLPYKNPVFIDRNGNYCAVGFLMKQSGHSSLAHAIDRDNKFVYVKDIKTKGVKEWADENGFSIDELAWIQPGYPVVANTEDLSGGLNGTVNCMIIDSTSQEIYAGGSFTSSTIGVPCNGVAQYISGFSGWDWIGIGDGVNGTVNAILKYNDKLYVGGDFTMAGTIPVSNIAVYDLSTNQWQSMGSLDSVVNSLVVYNNEIYAGGMFTGYVSKWTGSTWQDITQGFIYGEGVRTLEVWNNTLVMGGNFELTTGALRKHVAAYDGTQMGILGFGTTTPVNDFEIHRDTLYAGCDFVQGTDTCSIARFVNSDWEIVLKPGNSGTSYFYGTAIRQLLSVNQRLFCAGAFNTEVIFYFGNNLMEFQQDSNGIFSCLPLLNVDSSIHTFAVRGNTICFGGAFTNSITDTLNHIGLLNSVLTSIAGNPQGTHPIFNVFPNPASDKITIDFKALNSNKGCRLRILDVTGREVYRQEIVHQTFSIDLSSKNMSGIYLLEIVNEEGNVLGTQKILMD